MPDQALATALQFAPIIERVHGTHHPELTRVREITEELSAPGDDTDVQALFAELRTVTDDFAIPDDVCETFVATYQALEKAEAQAVGTRR